jgi:hypothetical protein
LVKINIPNPWPILPLQWQRPICPYGRKANWIGHILHKNYHLKSVIESNIEGRIKVMGRRGRPRKQLLDNLKEKTVLK